MKNISYISEEDFNKYIDIRDLIENITAQIIIWLRMNTNYVEMKYVKSIVIFKDNIYCYFVEGEALVLPSKILYSLESRIELLKKIKSIEENKKKDEEFNLSKEKELIDELIKLNPEKYKGLISLPLKKEEGR
jgi:hypothetical protein